MSTEDAEPIPVGRRIRDLIEGPDGRIWLWGDRGELMTIAVMEDVSRGEVVFAGCDACHPRHQDHEGRGVGAGPNLDNIIGRPVASGNYQYSAALKALGGTWTEERLDAFLADPGAFAPGTLMTYRLPDPADRAALIAFLRDMPLRF